MVICRFRNWSISLVVIFEGGNDDQFIDHETEYLLLFS